MEKNELNMAIFEITRHDTKRTTAKAHKIVSEAGYTIRKNRWGYEVANEATKKLVNKYTPSEWDFCGFLNKPYNEEWKSLQIYNNNVSEEGIGQAKRRYERIKYYKENIAMYDGYIDEIKKEIARRQERMIERAMDKQKAVAVLEGYRKELGLK